MLRFVENDAMSAVSDRALVERMSQDDRAAFDALFRRHARTVFAYAYTRVGERTSAEEVLQETFITAWERRLSVSLVTESAIPWLLATARYKSMNMQRKRARERTVVLLDTDPATSPDATSEAAERALTFEIVERAVAAMPELDRLVFALCVDDDRSYADAARDLGISHSAVRGRLSRIRARLRDEIALLGGH